MKSILAVGIIIAALFAIQAVSTPEVVVMATPTPTPTPTETPVPTPEPTPTPVPTVTPKPVNARVAYVQAQLTDAGFDSAKVSQLFADSRLKLYSIQTVAYKEPDWQLIKDKLYGESYVQRGNDYIALHRAAFEAAERDYGVPKGVLAGIIAIETAFGTNTGTTPTFNALYSRMRQWPEDKWKGQAAQLTALAKFCLQSKVDCFAIKGSYAGAMGIVQFMPISLLSYGVDGDKDGFVDLLKPVDAIPSAANFLIGHGWNEDQLKSIARYYGSSVGYPEIVMHYASLLNP